MSDWPDFVDSVAGAWEHGQIDLAELRERPGRYDLEAPGLESVPLTLEELDALVDVVAQMAREHSHHHIPGTATCYGCELLARFRCGESA